MTWPDDYTPLNGCRSCGSDFTSLDAFDAHRAGRHMPMERHCVDPTEVGLVRVQPGDSLKYDGRIMSGVPLYWNPNDAAAARQALKENAHAVR